MKRPTSNLSASDLMLWGWYRQVRSARWRWQTVQRLRSMPDEVFLRLAGLPAEPEAAVRRIQERVRQRLFFDAGNKKDFFLSVLTSLQSYDDILDEADEVIRNRFETLGSGLVDLGPQIDWHRDFRSDAVWPVRELSAPDLLQLGRPSDVKIPWELSRFHQTWWLGKAYWLSNRQEYADKFMSLVDDWLEKNPVGLGVNWSLAMEASIRAANWVIGWSFFAASPVIPPSFWVRFFKSLYVHGVFIEMNLEYAFARGNHFLSNVAGLVILGAVFRGTAFGDRWFAWGVRQLETEMGKQVYPDGVDYEKSTAYHRFVLELFYVPVIIAERNGHRFSGPFRERLHRMFRFMADVQRPDGTMPNIGDADDGRLFRIRRKQDVTDCRHAVSVGACMFDDPSLRAVSGGFQQEALWLAGTEGFEAYRSSEQAPPERRSVQYPDGGYAIMRSEDVHVIADVGDIGMEGWGGHGHNDTLSFEYWADGHPLIVDSGTYTYSADPDMRQQLRSVRAHNTCMVDGYETAEFRGLWSIRSDATRPVVRKWDPGTKNDLLVASHAGYTRLTDPVVHERSFAFDKTSGTLEVTDTLRGQAEHTLELSLHLHPSVQVESQNNNAYILRRDGRRYRISITGGSCDVSDGWFSPSYGVKQRNTVLRMRYKVLLPHTIRTTIDRLAT